MKPSSRAVVPGRGPRPPVERAPRHLPRRLAGPRPVVEQEPAPEDPFSDWFEPAEEADREPAPVRLSLRRRLRPVVLAGVVLAVLVEIVLLVRSLDAGASDPGASTTAPVEPALVAPSALPARGVLVTSEVQADGRVAVTQWLRSDFDLDAVSFSAPSLNGRSAEADGLRLVAADGTLVADDLTVGATAQRVRLDAPTRLVRATYLLDGVADAGGSQPGRVLVQALAVRLDTDADTDTGVGPTIVQVSAPDGQVRNLACADARSPVTLLRPCGAPDGAGWRVRLRSDAQVSRVVVQVDLGTAAAR